jgi:hypothetical protein
MLPLIPLSAPKESAITRTEPPIFTTITAAVIRGEGWRELRFATISISAAAHPRPGALKTAIWRSHT